MSPQAKQYLELERQLNVLTRQNPNDPERDNIAEQMDKLWDTALSAADRITITQVVIALSLQEQTNQPN